MQIKGSRIYVSEPAARKLGSAIPEILEKFHSEGRMEVYTPQKEQDGERREEGGTREIRAESVAEWRRRSGERIS